MGASSCHPRKASPPGSGTTGHALNSAAGL
jgi:hypothetical protein